MSPYSMDLRERVVAVLDVNYIGSSSLSMTTDERPTTGRHQ